MALSDTEVEVIHFKEFGYVATGLGQFARAIEAEVRKQLVPLTEAQRNAIYDKHCFLGDNGWEINWWQVVDEVEAAHGIGIKGGRP